MFVLQNCVQHGFNVYIELPKAEKLSENHIIMMFIMLLPISHK